ncbi:MAG: hypothetical protein GC160_29505 [Acidobacteria bacterium]|nr:hypothetical protein [Acidobacteriota bacterium]
MDLQRIDLKVFLDAPAGAKLEPVLSVFHRWGRQTDHPSDWVDLADYGHMQHGPAMLMAGKRDRVAVDTNLPEAGILLQTQKGLEGSIEERFVEAFRRHLGLSAELVGEPEWPTALRVRGGDWLVTINDRLGFPNTDATDQAVRAGLVAALDRLFGDMGYALERDTDPQRRYAYRVRVEGDPTLSELRAKLG